MSGFTDFHQGFRGLHTSGNGGLATMSSPDWQSEGFGPDQRDRKATPLQFDTDLILRRGLAAFRLMGEPLLKPGDKMGYRPNPDTELPSFTEVKSVREAGDHIAIRLEHRPPPNVDSLLVRVRNRTEDQEDAWQVMEAAASQELIKLEARWDPRQKLLFIYAGKMVASRIFRAGLSDGYWKGKPLPFELTRLRGDPDVLNAFQAWAQGTGRVTTHAFFGNNILEDEEVRKAKLSSVRVHLKTMNQEIVVFISADGRINCTDDTLNHDELYDLFHRLHLKLTPNRSLNESFE